MKKITFLVFIIISSKIFAQPGTFEKSFNPFFDSGLNSIITDSTGYFYSVGNSLLLQYIETPGLLIKSDINGNFVYEKHFDGQFAFRNIQKTPDGNMIISGNFFGCDIGSCGGFLAKLDTDGDSIWTAQVNPQEFCGVADYHWRFTLAMRNGNILFGADSTIYFYNSLGDSLFIYVMNERILSLTEGLDGNIICGTQQGITILDSAGQQVSVIALGMSVGKINVLTDSTYLIPNGSTLFKMDNLFNLISQLDLSTLNFQPSDEKIVDDKIWIRDSSDPGFIQLDNNLQVTDSFRVQPFAANVNDFAVVDTVIMVVGKENGNSSSCFMKSIHTTESTDYYQNDIALLEIIVDTIFVFQPPQLPAGVYLLKYVCKIKVENQGNQTINSFYCNSETFLSGVCGNGKYQQFFDSLNLAPGQTATLQLDTMMEYGLVISQFPFVYSFCPWINCPNLKPDLNHSDNELCDSIIFDGPTGIEFVNNFNDITIYPNPFTDLITIEIPSTFKNTGSIEILDFTGKKVFSCALAKAQIDLSQMAQGIYFIKIIIGNNVYARKIIKE